MYLADALRAQAAVLLDKQVAGQRLGAIEIDRRAGADARVDGLAVARPDGVGTRPPPRGAARVDLDLGADNGDAARIELDEAAACLDRQLRAGVDHDLLPRREMKFLADADVLPGTDLGVLGLGHRQVIVGLELDPAIQEGRTVLFLAQLRVAVGLDRIVSLIPDADVLVVLDVFIPVTLGVDVDLLLAPAR